MEIGNLCRLKLLTAKGHKASLDTLAECPRDTLEHVEGAAVVVRIFQAADSGTAGANALGKFTLAETGLERNEYAVTNRRELLKAAFAAPFLWVENRKPDATDWHLTRPRLVEPGGFRSPWIERDCSHRSLEAGETLEINVSTKPAATFRIEIFRMGYYGGTGARRTVGSGTVRRQIPARSGDRPTPPSPLPVGDERAGKIHKEWPSGVYLGRWRRRLDRSQARSLDV